MSITGIIVETAYIGIPTAAINPTGRIRMDTLIRDIENGRRIDPDSAPRLFGLELYELGRLADLVRRRVVGSEQVGFVIDRNITFTNYCEAACEFCAFHRKPGESGFALTVDEILDKVAELVRLGGTQVMLQGGLYSKHDLTFYTTMLAAIKSRFPEIHLHSLSPAEIHFLAQLHGVGVRDVLQALIDAGLDSLPGAAEILVDSVRRR